MRVSASDKTPQIFVIQPGESVNSIARRLENQKLIRNRLVFRIMVAVKGIERNIQAGDFRLYRTMTAEEVAEELTHGTLDVWVTVIEGMRTEEIAGLFSKSLNIPEPVFISAASGKEGYLFPDTYLVPKEAEAETVISIMEKNFNSKVNGEIVNGAGSKGLTLHELITLGSLLEREAQSYEDKRIVAGILMKRMELGMPLQVDASVQYALGYNVAEKTWWKKNLTFNDLKVDSPYNTYTNQGLPPGPIANPGLDSIRAIINARETDYLFYISDKNENMHYSKDLAEHEENVRRYINN